MLELLLIFILKQLNIFCLRINDTKADATT